jgi:CubicO group peptidase (beta-lactamase class C family)
MEAIKHLFRASTARDVAQREEEDFRRRLRERDDAHQKAEPQRTQNPVDAYPGFLIFLFRSLGLLRGLAGRLEVRNTYLSVLYDYAHQAMLDSCPVEDRSVSVVQRTAIELRNERIHGVVTSLLNELNRRRMIVGCQVAVYLGEEIVLDVAAGTIGKHNPRPVSPSTLFNVFSCTKGVMAVLFARLADKYGIAATDLVAKHWPAYGCKGKEQTTIAHLLMHKAGLATAAPEDMTMERLKDDWRGVVQWLATNAVPAHTPGAKSAYHFLTFGWLIAGLLENVSGRGVEEHVRKLASELGMSDEFFIGLPDELCQDSTSNVRLAVMSSEIARDLHHILKVRRERDAAVRVSAAEAAIEDGTGLDDMYEDNRDGGNQAAMEFLLGYMAGTRPSPEEETLSTNVGNERDTSNILMTAIVRTPYLVEPQYFGSPVLRAAVVPSANGHFSARALAKLFAALSNDGVVDSVRVVDPGRPVSMMDLGAEVEDDEGSGSDMWGAGVRVHDVVDEGGVVYKRGAMGHGGVGGSQVFCVPSARFSYAFTCNQLNVRSVAEATIGAVVCHMLQVPAPHSYAKTIAVLRDIGVNSASAIVDAVVEIMDAELDVMDVVKDAIT